MADALLLFAEGAQGEAAIELTQAVLTEKGLEVAQHGDTVLAVTAPLKALHAEAEHEGLVKTNVEGEQDDFEAAGCETVFPGSASRDFYSRAERNMLVAALIDDVRCDAARLDKAVSLAPSSDARHQRESPVERQLLVRYLKTAGALEDVCGAHDEKAVKELFWGKMMRWKPFVPVEAMREVFGDKVTLYFAWMRFFTIWLCAPGLVGLAMYLHRPNGMTVDDSPFVPFFSLFMVIWGILFVKFWRRQSATYACDWGNLEFERREHVRPEFYGSTRTSPVTGEPELYYEGWRRLVKYGVSFVVTAFMLCVAFFVMVCSLNLQGYIHVPENPFHVAHLFQYSQEGQIFDPNGPLYLSLIPVVSHSIVIYILNAIIYCRIAEWLTENENHRTEASFENALILKRFLFEAFDSYIALFYLAFYQNNVLLLRQELVGLYTTDAVRRVTVESILPLVLQKLSSLFSGGGKDGDAAAAKKKDDDAKAVATADNGGGGSGWFSIVAQARRDEYEAFDDWLEMVIELGYVTLFASAFPLAAAVSILCNLVEIHSDGFKLCYAYRRPRAHRAANIGTWESVMSALVWMSIVTNCLIFAFASDQLAVWMPWLFTEADGSTNHEEVMREGMGRYVVGSAWAIEHALFLLALLVSALVPTQPEKVRIAQAKRDYEAEQVRRQHREALRLRAAEPSPGGGAKARGGRAGAAAADSADTGSSGTSRRRRGKGAQ